MIRITLTYLALTVLTAVLTSCDLFAKKSKQLVVEKKSPVRLVGRVDKIDESAGFLMIRRYGRWSFDEGDLLESRGEGRAANLLPTGEKLGEHVAADIRSGKVEVGDGVYIRKADTSQETKSSDDPEKHDQTNNQEDAVNKP